MSSIRRWWRRVTSLRQPPPPMPLREIQEARRLVRQSDRQRKRIHEQLTELEARISSMRREHEERY